MRWRVQAQRCTVAPALSTDLIGQALHPNAMVLHSRFNRQTFCRSVMLSATPAARRLLLPAVRAPSPSPPWESTTVLYPSATPPSASTKRCYPYCYSCVAHQQPVMLARNPTGSARLVQGMWLHCPLVSGQEVS